MEIKDSEFTDPLNEKEKIASFNKLASSINSLSESVKAITKEKSAINDAKGTGESISRANEVSTDDASVVSSPSELSKEQVTEETKPTVVNINLEKDQAKPNQINESTKVESSNSTITSSINEDGSVKIGDTIKNIINPNSSEKSVINQSSLKKKAISTILKKVGLGSIAKTMDLPKLGAIKDLGKNLLNDSGSEFKKGFENIKNVFSSNNINGLDRFKDTFKDTVQSFKDSSKIENASQVINSAVEKIGDFTGGKEGGTGLETALGSVSSLAPSIIGGEGGVSEIVEKVSPGMSMESGDVSSMVSNLTQNIGGSGAIDQSTISSALGSLQEQKSASTGQSSPQEASVQPQPEQKIQAAPPVSFDTSDLARKIARLEQILVSGIEVTIKET